jgi:trimeric autotransporter adhesin
LLVESQIQEEGFACLAILPTCLALSILIATLIFSLSLARVAAAQGNTSLGTGALQNNTAGSFNTANGVSALFFNTTGDSNTASGLGALGSNTTGSANTAIGAGANVSTGNLFNATAIGAGALVDASNKIRLGNPAVAVIEGQVAFTATSDKTQKENFQPVDGEEVLGKIRGFELPSWNFIGHDPKEFRHYGPMAQDFFAAFGHDGVGQIGSETTINSGDLAGILMIAVQALEKRTAELKQKEAQLAALESKVEELKVKHAYFETVAARLEALEFRQNHSFQITAEKSLSFVATGE